MLDGGKIVSYLELDTSGYESTMKSVISQLEDAGNSSLTAGKRVQSLGNALSTVGSTLTQTVTVPLLAAGTAVSATAISFESAFAGVRKTVDATESEYAMLSEGLQDMSERIPASANELAGLMEIAGQLGVSKDNLLDFTEVIAGLGVATNLSGEEAATMLAQYANVMQMPLDRISNLGSVIVALGNSCATTEADIVSMAQRLAGTGNLLGLTNAEVMGLSATMSSLGISAEAGGSAMSRTMQTINSAVLGGTQEVAGFAQTAGMSVEAFTEAWKTDTMGALEAFIAGIGQINQSGGDAAGTLEALGLSDMRITDTILRMSGAQGALASNITLANQAWTDNNALTNEASQRYATTESQLQLAKNAITNMMTSLGNVLLPVITTVAQKIGEVAQHISALDSNTKQTIVTVAGIAAAAGPVLTILGKGVALLSGPAGWVALLGAAGIAAGVTISNMRKAAIQADLSSRFGEVTLSATDLDAAMVKMTGRSTEYSEAWTNAGDATEKAIASLKDSTLSLDTLLVKANLGLDVSSEELQAAATALTGDLKTAIEAERVKATVAIDTLFTTDDWHGVLLSGQIGAHFSVLQGEAEALGNQLAKAIEDGMADGFLDENEQATIEALRSKLGELLQQVADIETAGELYRWRSDVGAAGMLNARSITELLGRADTIYQGGVKEKQEARDYLKTLLSQQAADEGWSQAKYDAEAAMIDRSYEQSVQQWAAQMVQSEWEAIGGSLKQAYSTEFSQMQTLMDEARNGAMQAAASWADNMGYDRGSDEWAEAYAGRFKDVLQENIAYGMEDVISGDAKAGLQELYAALAPTHETLQELARSMGDQFPAELQSVLDEMDLMAMMVSDPKVAGSMLAEKIDPEPMTAAGVQAGEAAVDGLEEGSADAQTVGEQTAQGFAQGLGSGTGTVQQAARQLGNTAMGGLRQTLDVRSPSRAAREVGGYFGAGFAAGIASSQGSVWAAATATGKGSITALATAIDAHSPSKETLKQGLNWIGGFALGIGDRLGKTTLGKAVTSVTGEMGKLWDSAVDEVRKQQNAKTTAASNARTQASANAEKARQQAVLDGIRQTAAATLAADTQAYEQRMTQLGTQTQSLLEFAGSHAIWYQDDKGETATQAVKDRYDALIAEEKSRYEAQVKNLSTDAQKTAAKEAYDDRIALLKKQKDAEVKAVQEQYDLQKNMATDWLRYQKNLLSQELAAKRAAYEEEDYEDELADLQKKQRQSKSAREKRELQEQIDKMVRDHALEQEEAALQETLDAYDALIEAVNAGLIGMGDLTGSSAFGDLSFGTAGLSALDNLTSAQLAAVLGSLSQSALADGTNALVSASQMSAALQSAYTTSVQNGGNSYSIDLRGAVVRDESDIQRIVEELEKKLRETQR